ncbi:cytochrome P450 [Gymnopus androsaceus JB14]|uniref:Cytochrome P450 n=1 Tax=Gymnopus androsaceus JB14 TaxID=1447944 RepID=A0A6A4IEH1_9AGAR|nr:cytochrome P450 [Gymnopus androsaceus JB14]
MTRSIAIDCIFFLLSFYDLSIRLTLHADILIRPWFRRKWNIKDSRRTPNFNQADICTRLWYLPFWHSSSCTLGSYKKKPMNNHPPIVPIPADVLFRYPRLAYEDALKEHGSVIGVYRKNRLEFIVDDSLAIEVLTNESCFSAEHGTAAMLNMSILLKLPNSFIGNLDKLVTKGINPFMDSLIKKLAPVFEKHMFNLVAGVTALTALPESLSEGAGLPVDFDAVVHRQWRSLCLCSSLEILTKVEDLQKAAIKVASDIATVTGIYQNIGYWSRTFPTIWRAFIWLRIMVFSIPWTFRHIAWCVWKDLRVFNQTGNTDHIDPDCLVFHMIKATQGKLRLHDRLWIIGLTTGIVFASIHQTSAVVIWVVYELALRRECLPVIRKELDRILETDISTNKRTLTYSSLRNAEYLDSFIREVMRLKGDTLAVIRMTTRDVKLGNYIIPKDSFITPLATLSHENTNYYGEDASKFISDRWVGTDKTASSISSAYWPFGLGRFACPGRILAIAEIKLIVLFLLARADIALEGNKYKIVDPLTITSVPPEGCLLLKPLQSNVL